MLETGAASNRLIHREGGRGREEDIINNDQNTRYRLIESEVQRLSFSEIDGEDEKIGRRARRKKRE